MPRKPTYEELEQKVTELEERLHGVDIRQLWDVYTQSTIPTLILSKEGKIEYFNDAMAQLTGYAHEEVPDIAAWMPKIYPDEKYRNKVIEISRGSRHREVDVKRDEFIITTKNGERRHSVFSVYDIFFGGNPTNVQVVQGEDITERKQAEEELRSILDREQLLADIVRNASVAIGICYPDGRLGICNAAFEELTGYSEKELRMIDWNAVLTPPEWRRHESAKLEELHSTKRSVCYEKECIHKDGSMVPIEVVTHPRLDNDGNIESYFGFITDITERKRLDEELRKHRDELEKLVQERTSELTKANEQLRKEIEERKQSEEALRESENLMRRVLNTSPNCVFAKDRDGRYILVNKAMAELYGTTIEGMVGKTQVDFMERSMANPEEVKQFLEADRKVIDSGKPELIPLESFTRSGQRRWFQTSKVPLSVRDNPNCVLGVAVDITERVQAEEERKQLEAQLRQAQKMEAIGTLAGGIAHDFNNLLMAAQGNLSLMLYEIDSTHPHYEPLKNIEKQIKSGATLTSQLLGYARKGQYRVRPISLTELVEETSNAFGRTRKDTTIHRELADDLFAIEADQGQIEQVLLNLYVNATDAMLGGGELTLKTMNVTHKDMKDKMFDPKPGNYVLLTVTDTGAGIHKAMQARIFDPFFTTKEMGRGTGLGLASAYGIVKSHGGYIDVDSEEGKGTTFSIYLPATQKKVEKIVMGNEEIVMGNETILVVDDEAMVLDAAVKVLEKLGYTVLEAINGREAVEIYKKNKDKIDMVVLDMVMPEMGGGKAYDRMKEMNPKVKVLLSSGYSIDSEAKEILARGCDGFIQKPFDMKRLSQAVRGTLENQ